MFVVVDIENFLRSSKTFHQSRELTPVAQTVDCIAADLSPRLSTFERCWLVGATGREPLARDQATRASYSRSASGRLLLGDNIPRPGVWQVTPADAVTPDGNPR